METPILRTPDRLCPTTYHSYRRHSSPSALGDTAGFEFPDSNADAPCSPSEDSPSPIRHGGPRNHSSPFLSRGNVRGRAQSSSSDFVSAGIEIESSVFSHSPDDIFSDSDKFELQAPPKRKHRSRTCSVGPSVFTEYSSSRSSTKALLASPANIPTPHNSPSSQTQAQSTVHDNTADRAKRKILNASGDNSEAGCQGDEVFYVPSKPPNHRQRSSTSVARRERSPEHIPPIGCLGTGGESGPQSPSPRRSNSPCRLYKIVKEAEERVCNLKSQFPSGHRPRSPASPLNSPRSPTSPSTSSVSAGVVVTSSKPSRRRSSISSAAAAFAAATAGASPSYAATSPTATKFRFGE